MVARQRSRARRRHNRADGSVEEFGHIARQNYRTDLGTGLVLDEYQSDDFLGQSLSAYTIVSRHAMVYKALV